MPDKESNLFDQLRSKQLVGVSRDNFSSATDQTFIEECNLDEFKLINVIGQATNMQSQSGPIPGTGQVHESATVTDNTRTIAFAPGEGEVWEIMSVNCIRTSVTSSSYFTLYIYDTVNSVLMQIFTGASTSGTFMAIDDGSWSEFTIDENCELQFVADNAANWAEAKVQLYLNRVR